MPTEQIVVICLAMLAAFVCWVFRNRKLLSVDGWGFGWGFRIIANMGDDDEKQKPEQ